MSQKFISSEMDVGAGGLEPEPDTGLAGATPLSAALDTALATHPPKPITRNSKASACPTSSALPAWIIERGYHIGMEPAPSDAVAPDTPCPQFLTVPEVAAALRVCARTVRRRVADGQIPHIRVGRMIRIPRRVLTDGQ